MPEVISTRTISNLGLSNRRRFFSGIKSTRKFIERAGADGLAWTPLNSRLTSELRREIAAGRFENTVGRVALIASMDQTFAQTAEQSRANYLERKASGESYVRRALKLGREAVERCIMPPSQESMNDIKMVAEADGQSYILTNLYVGRYDLTDTMTAPFDSSVQLTPDVLEELGVAEMQHLPDQLDEHGIYNLSFSGYNAERNSLTGKTQMPDWREWLPEYAQMGYIKQIAISLNRTDLPSQTGEQAAKNTHTLGHELVKDEPDLTRLGDLPEQLRTIVENSFFNRKLHVNLRGNLHKYKPDQIRKIFENIEKIAGLRRPGELL
ncbi:MAG TPA: hypothetical protein VLA77_03485 [Candidatus Saccharimonadales bacterium]|nr:hypothetical protein [Candidatus Saccharimonadales bacterium]